MKLFEMKATRRKSREVRDEVRRSECTIREEFWEEFREEIFGEKKVEMEEKESTGNSLARWMELFNTEPRNYLCQLNSDFTNTLYSISSFLRGSKER